MQWGWGVKRVIRKIFPSFHKNTLTHKMPALLRKFVKYSDLIILVPNFNGDSVSLG